MPKADKYWALTIFILVAIIAVGSMIIRSKYSRSQPVEIYIPPHKDIQGQLYIGGAVSNPGYYPLKAGDSIDGIIQATGGVSAGADFNRLNLYIPEAAEEESPQKVDLNRADPWLLQALPGIGEVRAQAIIDYRLQNGQFRNTSELIMVEGISTATFDKIKHLITVAD